ITCSMMNASPLTTSVMRDTVGSSVSPTDKLSMLYPRAENNPATRDSTPNLFSTITAIVCFSNSVSATTPVLSDPLLPIALTRSCTAARICITALEPHRVSSAGLARAIEGGGSEGAVEAPFDDLKPGLGPRGLLPHLAGRRSQDHIGVRPARGHHGEHALVLVDADVQHHRSGRADHLLDG